jgi:tetratricopeptide (TPR) repeat protein
LPLDQGLWDRAPTADNAIQLGETLLTLDRAGEAVQILGSLDRQRSTPASQALLAVALARQGKLNEARAIAASTRVTEPSDPVTLYLTARMHAVVGQSDQALSALGRCFQAVPPSRLEALKSLARECPELAALASLSAFETVLRTPSRVAESKCSGGSSCSSCPMRGGCAHGESK